MKLTKDLALVALILACIYLVWDSFRKGESIDAFEANEERLKTQYDSITALRNAYAVEYLKQATELSKAKLALSNEREANKSLRQRNEALKIRPVKHYTDSAARREVTRLVGEH